MNAPKLRFKDKDGKDFPEWEERELYNIADKNIKWSFTGGPFGSNLKASDYVEDGIRVIQLQNIGDGLFLDDYKIYTTEQKAEELLSCNIYPGDILLSKMGDPVGRACFVPNLCSKYVMCSDGIRLAVNKKQHCPYFILLRINSRHTRKHIERSSTGSTRKRIGLEELKHIKIILPSLPEQQKIADFLSSVDDRIAQATKKLELLEHYKKGAMQQIFSQKIRFKDETGGEFPEWKEDFFRNLICNLDSGVSVLSSDNTPSRDDFCVLKTSCIFEGQFFPEERKTVVAQNEILRLKTKLLNDSLLVSRMNTPALVGMSAYVAEAPAKTYLPDRLWQITKTSTTTSLKFLSFLFIAPDIFYKIRNCASGTSSSMKNISKKDFMEIAILIPSLPEQQKIADFLSAIDDKIQSARNQLDALKMFKKGLLQQMFI